MCVYISVYVFVCIHTYTYTWKDTKKIGKMLTLGGNWVKDI